MGLVIFKRYSDIGEATIAFSALEAAGFHPSWQNYNHANLANIEMIAFGGLIVQLPASEVADAKAWLSELREQPTQGGDAIPPKKRGLWHWFVSKPLLLVAIWLVVLNAIIFMDGSKPLFMLVALLIIPLSFLLHAHYIAVPNSKRRQQGDT